MSREGADTGRWDREIIRQGKILVHRFFVLHKTSGNYSRRHPAMEAPIADLLTTVREIHRRREEAAFSLRNDHLFCGEFRLKPDAAGFDAYIHITRIMKKIGIGTMNFTPRVRPAEIDEMSHLIVETEQLEGEQFQPLVHRMRKGGIEGIEIELLPEEVQADEVFEGDDKERSKAIYSRTLDVVSEVMDDVKSGKTLKLKKSKRLVMNMIDSLLTAETNLLVLTNIRCHDEYTFNHSVNVGILSLAIGQRMGLHKRHLVELGMASLFHDIGKSLVPLEILNKPSRFSDEDWAVMRRHPIFGVKELMQLKGIDALTARIITGAFEHHLNYNLSGYPKVPYGKKTSLFGRIICVADCYDAISSSRVYNRTAEPPDRTLQFMMERSGTDFDPLILKLFVHCIGVYPAGTLCFLNTGELAVILESNPDPERWSVPKVKIISDSSGNEVDGAVVDLTDPGTKRSIAQTVDAKKHDIDVSRYFL